MKAMSRLQSVGVRVTGAPASVTACVSTSMTSGPSWMTEAAARERPARRSSAVMRAVSSALENGLVT